MNLNIRHTIGRIETPATCLAVAMLLVTAGCSRESANASANGANTDNPRAASVRSAEVANQTPSPQGIELVEPPGKTKPRDNVVHVDAETSPADADVPAVNPLPLDEEPVEPGHDALLVALEVHGGDLPKALEAISVRIERSTRCDISLLNLKGPYITDASLEKIKTLDTLLVLDIWDAPITDSGLAHLADMTQMRALGLRETKVTDKGLRHLSQLTSLKELNLTLTHVTDAGMRHLTGLKSLHALGLDDTAVTGAGINELQAALPLCRIAW